MKLLWWRKAKDGPGFTLDEAVAQFGRIRDIIDKAIVIVGSDRWETFGRTEFPGNDPSNLDPSQLVNLLERCLRRLNIEKNESERQKVRLNGDLDRERAENCREIEQLQQNLRHEKATNQQVVESLETENARNSRRWEDYVEQLKAEHLSKEEHLREKHRAEQHDLHVYWSEQVQDKNSHIEGLHAEAKREKERRDKQEEELRREHDKKQEELIRQHTKATEKLKRTHLEQQTYLKKEVQSRNKALVTRDTFPHITDRDVKSRFSDLVREVDGLARLPWTLNRSDWSDEVLKEVSDSPKRLQQHIIRETIWSALHKHIFCSPFRVFGAEGKDMEEQWNKNFGKDSEFENDLYTWSKPSFEAERWRFDPLRQAKSALDAKPSNSDSRMKLWLGFFNTIDDAKAEIKGHLSKVSNLEANDDSIQDLCEKAGKMWVLFQSQRCRIQVVVYGIKAVSEFSRTKDGGGRSVDFVYRPEVRRVGDSEGELFEKVEMVDGCAGEMVRYKW